MELRVIWGMYYRLTARLGHRLGLHKWRCYQDLDGVNISPDVPWSQADWRVCSWCGRREVRPSP